MLPVYYKSIVISYYILLYIMTNLFFLTKIFFFTFVIGNDYNADYTMQQWKPQNSIFRNVLGYEKIHFIAKQTIFSETKQAQLPYIQPLAYKGSFKMHTKASTSTHNSFLSCFNR